MQKLIALLLLLCAVIVVGRRIRQALSATVRGNKKSNGCGGSCNCG